MGEVLSVRDLNVYYGDQLAIEDIAFTLREGRLVGVVGPNGAGKSTMIKAIVGSLKPASGVIEVFGSTDARARRRITYVPQRGSVDWDFPVTVKDVVTQGRYGNVGFLKRFSAEDHAKVANALSLVNLTDLASRQIGELSGGQQQRVFLARALAQQGDIYLMDEPFVGVDAATESAIVDVLRGLRDAGKTVLVVHHDLATVGEYFDDVILMNRKIIAHGPIEQYFTPELLQKTYGGRLAILGNDKNNVTLVTS